MATIWYLATSGWLWWAVAAVAAWFGFKFVRAGSRELREWWIVFQKWGVVKPSAKAVAENPRPSNWGTLRSDFMEIAFLATGGDCRCMYCGAHCGPDNVEQTEVDHIKPVKDYPELAADMTNFGISCMRCNRKKGAKKWYLRGYTVDPRIARLVDEYLNNGSKFPRYWRKKYG